MPARGVSIEQDPHFKDKEKVLLQTSKFPSVFSERVDMSKVSVPVMRPWIATRVEQMLGFEDEVLVEFILGLLEAEQVRYATNLVSRPTQDANCSHGLSRKARAAVYARAVGPPLVGPSVGRRCSPRFC